jgi:membrane dipeptidase
MDPTPGSARHRYDSAVVIDGCAAPDSGLTEPTIPLSVAEIENVRRSGLTCVNVTVGPVGTTPPDEAFAKVMRSIDYWEAEIDRSPEVFVRIRSAADIESARRSGRTGLSYAFQDAVAFEVNLSLLEAFHARGVRVIQPTYNRRNRLGDGCLEPVDGGLTPKGVEAIERMNELGILVDLSHCGRLTAAHAIAVSKAPVAFTHTGCAALADHPRNRTDEELRAVAKRGGVAGIYVMPYLDGGRQPTAANLVHHLEHAIEVAGEDHVAIGTDGSVSPVVLDEAFRKEWAENTRKRREAGIAAPGETEEGYLFASDLNTPRRLETLAGMLETRGHPGSRIEKILGGNLLRLFRDVWAG